MLRARRTDGLKWRRSLGQIMWIGTMDLKEFMLGV
jgi:hypothetical protein